MAVKELESIKIDRNVFADIEFDDATVADDGFKYAIDSSDEDLVILVHNTADTSETLTLKAPGANGFYAAATEDQEIELAAGAFAALRIESAVYAKNDCTINLIPSDVGVKVAVLR